MTPDSSSPIDAPPEATPDAYYYTLSPKLVALESPARSRPAVEVHELAAQVIAQQVERGRRGVVVCAPNGGVGATLVSVNLGIAMAQAGVSVLLVDGDLHRPGIETLVTPSQPTMGLQQVLRSSEPLNRVICSEVLPGLS